jgi:hypothetical protein
MKFTTSHSTTAAAAWLLLAAFASGAFAQAQPGGFGASVSPPRVEIQVNAGATKRQVIDITHAPNSVGRYRVYTNDWRLQADGSVEFGEALADETCRPWVAIERRDLSIQPQSRYRYRFEVTAPSVIPDRECRFALMIEGVDPLQVEQQGVAMPVSGRIAVIVYVAVGNAKPKLEVQGSTIADMNGVKVPAIIVKNVGNAHGRFDGVVEGVDADGRKIELLPSNQPILPGDTRTVALVPSAEEGKPAPTVKYPLEVKGSLEVGKDRLPLSITIRP